MVLLESEQFLSELTRLFQKCQVSGSVFITLKKYDGRTKPIPRKGSVEGFEPADKCLFRATDGKKKISTVVSSKEATLLIGLELRCQSLNMVGLEYTMKNTLQIGDPMYMRKVLVNNMGEEKRTRLHIQKLQKALNSRCREIDKEKVALRKFLTKLHKTTGYFPRLPFW
ncbi:Signal recognition particle 14 kDa protein [Galemys pyrenaicus]|uniref:Signal recognition particle 14 kDa protein n=1 Tax=Galemys pyrenaicus TaxID=202257 RepID=A0A8J6B6U9_GALPY|nr:Signal recognition particle 14 kDa protein [Galemys pyrenaicus]